MQTLDEQVLGRLCAWLQGGSRAWLCTIVATSGSSPRPVGSLFACDEQGVTVGSLSGGCVEEELVAQLCGSDSAPGTELLPTQVLEYGVTAADNERLGLPCGGRLWVLVETLQASALPHISELYRAVQERRYLLREVLVEQGSYHLHAVSGYARPQFENRCLRQVFGPRYRMLLIGAGQLSQSVAELAVAMDYQVLVCDPRPGLLAQWAGAPVQLLGGMPDDAVRAHATDKDCIVLTLTHDPRIDDMALMQALQQELFYVGALGSQRTSAARRERLLQLDISEQQLARLHAPVGLDIGSKTPMEIAVSIIAQLTQLRAARLRQQS